MSDRGLKPLFVLDAMANGALLGAVGAGIAGAGGEDPMLRLYALGLGAAMGAFAAAGVAGVLTTKLSEDQLRLGIRVLVGVFLLTWIGALVVSRLGGG